MVLENVNRLLQMIRGRGMATAAYAIFDPETGELRVASAGHPPPLIVASSNAPQFLQLDPGPPLGIISHPTFPETSTTLAGDDMVLLYTDGLIEVRGESLEEGFERLAVASRGADSADALCRNVTRALVSPEASEDDVALIALRNSAIPGELAMRFPADPTVLSQVRRVLRRWIHQFGAGREDVGAVTLACGEACANAIEHAYPPGPASFEVEARSDGSVVTLAVRDRGRWRTPRGQNRGRGLMIMKASMDEVDVRPTESGTEVLMRRRLRG
jgi:anti-sigma regulatory factor (Ser/Thr protein kinase)